MGSSKRLQLSKETLRALTTSELDRVGGGGVYNGGVVVRQSDDRQVNCDAEPPPIIVFTSKSIVLEICHTGGLGGPLGGGSPAAGGP
jgi:hypothetical protein